MKGDRTAMKLYAPKYYKDFRCIADACRHSCCIGWEIDIDPETLCLYRKQKGAFAKRLKESIVSEDGAHFRLDENERCPFLNEKGLCDIILTMGEESLSQICTDHPRFRNFFSDRTEIGLGLCCEEACRLLLAQEEKLCLVSVGEEEEVAFSLDAFEREILAFREKLFAVAQDRSVSLSRRIAHVFSLCDIPMPQKSMAEWADILLSLERMDAAWDGILTAWKCTPREPFYRENEIAFEQLLWYFIYRHASSAEDLSDLRARGAFAALSVFLIACLHASQKTELAEICRLYSAEIEYSEENTEALIALLAESK